MSEEVSTNLPNAMKLPPHPPKRAKVWQALSYVLIVVGLGLLAAGSWMFIQYQMELRNPPARILEVSINEAGEVVISDPDPAVQPELPLLKPTPPVQLESNTQTQTNPAPISASEAEKQPPLVDEKPPTVENESLETTTTENIEPGENVTELDETKELETEAPYIEPVDDMAIEKAAMIENALASKTEVVETPVVSQEPLPSIDTKLLEETTLIEDQDRFTAIPTPEANPEAALTLDDNPLAAPPAADSPPNVPTTGPSPTRLVAESIDIDTKIVEVGWQQIIRNGKTENVWVVAGQAAGWHTNSLPPGQGGNVVLSGHHNVKGEVFRYLVDVEVGDIFTVYVDDQRYDYAVHDKFIVKDKGEPEAVRLANAKWIGPFAEERLTLVTCWPYNNNTHRLIVIAKPL